MHHPCDLAYTASPPLEYPSSDSALRPLGVRWKLLAVPETQFIRLSYKPTGFVLRIIPTVKTECV